jgi:uncharacterized membrane protein YphA (DoxX/SURF4 family)
MNAMNVLNIVLWSVQGFLALFFLAAGAPKISGRGIEKWTGFSDLPRSQVVFIGFAEVLGAAGLVLPMATRRPRRSTSGTLRPSPHGRW